MLPDTNVNTVPLLQTRAAILQDVCEGETYLFTRGSITTFAGSEDGGTAGVLVEHDGSSVHQVPIEAVARIDADGTLPTQHCVSIMYSVVVGSRAQALATNESDTDRRGFYVASPDIHFGLDGSPEQLVHDEDQLCYWEVEKFLRLALKANPTVLETLYSPHVELAGSVVVDEISRLKQQGSFLSKRAQQTFMGYANSQFDKMTRALERGGVFKWQHAMHLIRLLRVGIRLMRSGELDVVTPPDERAELRAIKQGERPWEDVCVLREQLVREFEVASRSTPLPDEPDFDAVSRFLVRLRSLSVEAVLND